MSNSKKANGKVKTSDTQPSSLTISRNKHWRYISAFHGPWLQLPHEILETLAHSNYFSPCPRQTHPAVLYDLLKVRKLVDEAADLAVRAQNGTASSALSTDNGMPGSALGFNTRGAGGNAKLSPERKYRMRELATQKLAAAYRLDEIAASVATMQSASTLDSVASLVLQRSPSSVDAKYVHFFHEKIPSRMMAEHTPLTPLDEIIAQNPGHAAPFRTRAITKIFKEEFHGAIHDLTEALAICRQEQVRHNAGKNQLVSMKTARDEAEKRRVWSRDWMQDNRVADDDQPKGLELQILFQRGNQWLTLACQHIKTSLSSFSKAKPCDAPSAATDKSISNGNDISHKPSNDENEAMRRAIEHRETVRKYAKQALRDYTTFFSQLDYAFASAGEADAAIFDRDVANHDGLDSVDRSASQDETSSSSLALIRRQRNHEHANNQQHKKRSDLFEGPQLTVYDIARLFSASPPADLPSFPTPGPASLALKDVPLPANDDAHQREMITYHPLMLDVLHSMLLAHCLLQTPPRTLHRIATNAARVARLADGYPFFLSARSPARADWAEILRKADNWIGLDGTWESLCRSSPPTSPVPSRTQSNNATPKSSISAEKAKKAERTDQPQVNETDGYKKDRIHKEAVMGALGDERVVDDESFEMAVNAREKRALRELDQVNTNVSPSSPALQQLDGATDSPIARTSTDALDTPHSEGEPFGRARASNNPVAKDEEYLIGTIRAENIAKWVLEAPVHVGGAAGKPRRKKKGGKKPATMNGSKHAGTTLEGTVDDLDLGGAEACMD